MFLIISTLFFNDNFFVLVGLGPQHSLRSVFYNDLFAFDLDRKRWFKLGVKAKAEAKSKTKADKTNSLKLDSRDGTDGPQLADIKISDSRGHEEEQQHQEVDDDDEENEPNDENYEKKNMFGYIDEFGNVAYIEMDAEEFDSNNEKTDFISAQSEAIQSSLSPEKQPEMSVENENINLKEIPSVCLAGENPEHAFEKMSSSQEREYRIEGSKNETVGKDSAVALPHVTKGVVNLTKYFSNLKEPSPRINPAIFIRYFPFI